VVKKEPKIILEQKIQTVQITLLFSILQRFDVATADSSRDG
jgi:hypothetical protein